MDAYFYSKKSPNIFIKKKEKYFIFTSGKCSCTRSASNNVYGGNSILNGVRSIVIHLLSFFFNSKAKTEFR